MLVILFCFSNITTYYFIIITYRREKCFVSLTKDECSTEQIGPIPVWVKGTNGFEVMRYLGKPYINKDL